MTAHAKLRITALAGVLALVAGCGGGAAPVGGSTPTPLGSEDPDGPVLTVEPTVQTSGGADMANPSPLPSPTTSREQKPRDLKSGVPTPALTKHQQAADEAVRRGLTVWVETDLVKHWLAGPQPYNEAIAKVKAMAERPGVAGVKIADELGYNDGMDSPRQIKAFLAATAKALRKAVPDTQVMLDFYVPGLGCQPNSEHPKAKACREAADWKHPQISLGNMDHYLAGGYIDVLNLSTAIQPEEVYKSWGSSRAETQKQAWTEVTARGWANYVTVHARRGLAHPGRFDGDKARAKDLEEIFVGIPMDFGVAATDIWTWRQAYKNDTYRLMDPGMKSNALWEALRERRKSGARLMTHFTPSSVEKSVPEDLAVLSTVFTDVLIAAGTG
ncbi:hypothetical protein [Nonomuraea sp. NPDC046570]|uniref:hypothetical protein n=1 Tax=Nonomuraea sp. NPDC046570 TaxID=3155255 RepID=UPI0033F12A4D